MGLLAICALLCLTSCTRFNWRGRGYNDETTGWTRNMRPDADPSKFSGLDARAQDIERNLGVR